jgi:hypothetical protein
MMMLLNGQQIYSNTQKQHFLASNQSLMERKKKKTLLRKLSEKRAQKYEFKQQQISSDHASSGCSSNVPYRPMLNHGSHSNSSSSSSSLNNSPSITLRKPSITNIQSVECKSVGSSLARRNMSTSDLSCVVLHACNNGTSSAAINGSGAGRSNNKLEPSSFKKFSVSNLCHQQSPSLSNLSSACKPAEIQSQLSVQNDESPICLNKSDDCN